MDYILYSPYYRLYEEYENVRKINYIQYIKYKINFKWHTNTNTPGYQ